MRYVLLGIAVFAGTLVATAVQADPSKAYDGRKLFNSYCYLCHGVDGKGKGPLAAKLTEKPKNLTGAEAEAKSDREIFRIIQGTAPHGTSDLMPKWGQAIPETDIQALVAYVRFLQRSEHPLLGDPEMGRAVYERYCVVCHGEKGKGDGMLTELLPIKPADHTNPGPMNRINNQELMKVIANGSTGKSYMPAWTGILSREEMEAVASYIRLLSYK